MLWLWHFLYSIGPHSVSSLHIYTFVVSRAFMADVASQAGDTDSSRAPGLASGLQRSVNVHRSTLLLVPQWQCISSFVFYIVVKYNILWNIDLKWIFISNCVKGSEYIIKHTIRFINTTRKENSSCPVSRETWRFVQTSHSSSCVTQFYYVEKKLGNKCILLHYLYSKKKKENSYE